MAEEESGRSEDERLFDVPAGSESSDLVEVDMLTDS